MMKHNRKDDSIHKNHEEKKESISISIKEYEELKKKASLADEHLDMLKRLQADFENTKKRIEKEKLEFIKFANDEIISRLLPVLDNFRRALDNSLEEHSVKDIMEGVKLIDKQFEDVLKDFGLSPIEALGKKFDPHYHEAVFHEETDEYEEDVVIEEFQAGYLLNGKLLRASKVKVAKKKEGN